MIASHLGPAGRTTLLPQLQSSRAVISTTVSRSPWRHEQTRGIRLEFWSWNLQPGSRGHQACHKISKSAYIEALNRKLLRNRHHRLHISNSSMKSFMCSAFYEDKSRVNLQKLKNDATRTASNLARATSGSINTSRKATTDGRSGRAPSNDGLLNLKYEIDPITNRKVFKQDSSTLSPQTDTPASHIPNQKLFDHGPPVSQFPGPQPLSKQSTKTALDGLATSASQSKGTYVTDSELYRDGRTVEQELGVYTPFQHNEPDGHFPPPPDPVEQALSNGRSLEEELGEYQPFRYNEPDGQFAPPPDPVNKALNEFDQEWDPELKAYTAFRHNEPNGHIPPPPNPVDQALNDLDKKSDPELKAYTAFRHNEPDGHFPPPPDPVEQGLNEFDQKWDPELDAYVPFRHNEPDGHFPPPVDPVEQALNEFDQKWDPELDAYVPFRHNEPDGHFPPPADPVNKALNEFDQKWEPRLENDNFFFDEDFDAERAAQLVPNTAEQKSSGKQEKDTSSKIIKSSRKESKKEKQARRRKMEEDFEASSTQFSKDIEAVAKSDKIRAARERAQEFEIERSELLNHQGHLRGKVNARLREIAELDKREAGKIPASESSSLKQDQAGSSAKDGEPEPFVFVSSYGTDLPPAAKAVKGSKGKKLNIKGEEARLKSAFVKELVSIYQDSYGAAEQQPTLYKIVAYNPDTKSILTTETTSIVPPGQRKPLSPASVLPRLSKPASFLPHIAPLLDEGYEIASGDGHVLVFRKVRDGPPQGSPAAKAETETQARNMTNPIDGMQSIRPATGNFASPTGFVNHDLPEYHIKSGTESGQESHTYGSSGSGWKDQEWYDRAARRQKGKKKVKRLLIGAVWVGGLSYAVGVVAEFFRTGGTDGMGAVGL